MSYKHLVSDSADSPPPYSDDLATAPPQEMKLDNPSPHGMYPQVPVHQVPVHQVPVHQVPVHQVPQISPPVTVVHQTNVVVDSVGQGMICPHCNARIRVRVEHHATGKTYCLALMLFLFLCWPCICAPCCCNCCYKTSQFCPNCNACLGSF